MAKPDENAAVRRLQEKLGSRIIQFEEFRGDHIVIVARDGLLETFRLLRDDPELRYDFLTDITVVDYWKKKTPRFEVVYQLSSFHGPQRLRVKVPVEEADPAVPSLTPLWSGANWLEREAWDMYGIRFLDHPDLRRVLLYEEFQGHPLRKDYPVNQTQPRVAERQVEGTFVDQRSHNKLVELKRSLGQKSRSGDAKT